MRRYDDETEALLGGTPALAPAAKMPLSNADDRMMGGAYEGSSRTSRELALWRPSLGSADSDMLPAKWDSDARARDVTRNDAFMQSGATLTRDGVVGTAFLLNAKPMTEYLKRQDSRLDDVWEREFQEEAETIWGLYTESADAFFDAARGMTFTEQVRLAVGVGLYSGEFLSTAEWIRDGSVRPLKSAMQAVEVDRLSTPTDRAFDPKVVAGVEQGPYGQAVGFHIRMAHETDYFKPESYRWKYVPARKPWGRIQVIHLKEQIRPDQTRAISQMTAGMRELRATRTFRGVTLQNAIVNASYAASIESELPYEIIAAQLGSGNADAPAATLEFAGRYLAAIEAYTGGAKNMAIDGVKIPHFFPGTKLQLRPMGTPGGVGTDFEAALLRYLAASLDMSYEELSRDYSKSNYSSIRAALNQTNKAMASRKRIFAERYANHSYALVLEEALNNGLITSMPRGIERTANFYDGFNKQAYCHAEWIGSSRGQIDELKETQAAVLRMKHRLTTLEYEKGRLGLDWRADLKQAAREIEYAEELGLPPVEPDPNQMNAASGTPREPENNDGGAAEGDA